MEVFTEITHLGFGSSMYKKTIIEYRIFGVKIFTRNIKEYLSPNPNI